MTYLSIYIYIYIHTHIYIYIYINPGGTGRGAGRPRRRRRRRALEGICSSKICFSNERHCFSKCSHRDHVQVITGASKTVLRAAGPASARGPRRGLLCVIIIIIITISIIDIISITTITTRLLLIASSRIASTEPRGSPTHI